MCDLDLDGLRDIFVANGRVQHGAEALAADPYAEPNQVLRQVRPGWFEDVTAAAGPALGLIESSRAGAFGDFDNDGDVDVLVVNCGGPARLLRNDSPRGGAFLSVRVLDEHGRDALGATLRCVIGGATRVVEVRAAYSYCATNDPRVHLGLGPAPRVDRIEVRWVDGATTSHGPYDAGAFVTIRR
jgi:hypothetical protein